MSAGTRFASLIIAMLGSAVVVPGSNTAAAVELVPALPCYKCEFNGSMINPNFHCNTLNPELFFDYGKDTCMEMGKPDGSTDCETSGEVCWWLMPISSLTGTGIPSRGLGVVAEATGEMHNCRGEVLAWGGERPANAQLQDLSI